MSVQLNLKRFYRHLLLRVRVFWRVEILFCVPQAALTRLFGYLARSRRVWLKNRLIHWFHQRYKIDMTQAEIEDPLAYESLEAFFIRTLKKDARPIAESTWVSPCDSQVSQVSIAQQGQMFQAKGRMLSLSDLLGSQEAAKTFEGASTTTLYLSPRDYHRVHMPVDGKILDCQYYSGRFFSVNRDSAKRIPNLYARNERACFWIETQDGSPLVLVMVGAMIVGGISSLLGHCALPETQKAFRDQKPELRKGDMLGTFHFGSTVILVSSKPVLWNLKAGQTLCLGQSIV